MKRMLSILMLSALFVSCGYNKQEQMFYDYVNDGVKNILQTEAKNIGFKIIEFKEVQQITAKDSLNILLPYFEEKKNNKIRQAQDDINRYKKFIEEYTKEVEDNKLPSMKDWYLDKIKQYERDVNFAQGTIDLYNGNCAGTFLEKTYNDIQKYKSDENKVLSTKYLGKHSIKNPLLNNVEQTIEEYYYSDETNTKIIKTEDIN